MLPRFFPPATSAFPVPHSPSFHRAIACVPPSAWNAFYCIFQQNSALSLLPRKSLFSSPPNASVPDFMTLDSLLLPVFLLHNVEEQVKEIQLMSLCWPIQAPLRGCIWKQPISPSLPSSAFPCFYLLMEWGNNGGRAPCALSQHRCHLAAWSWKTAKKYIHIISHWCGHWLFIFDRHCQEFGLSPTTIIWPALALRTNPAHLWHVFPKWTNLLSDFFFQPDHLSNCPANWI